MKTIKMNRLDVQNVRRKVVEEDRVREYIDKRI